MRQEARLDPTRGELLALALLQAALSGYTFRRPRRFWPLMTPGLTALGLPAWHRLRRRPEPAAGAWLAAGAALGAAAYGLTWAAASVLERSPAGRRWLSQLARCRGDLAPALAALLVLPAATGEELFWRRAVLGSELADGSQAASEVARASLLYALVQGASGQPLPPAGGLLLGLTTGWVRLRSGSIWPAVAAHIAYSELCLVAPGLPGAGN